MHTDSDIFSSPKTSEAEASQALTERLYPESTRGNTFEELKRLLGAQKTDSPDVCETDSLERAIKIFQSKQLEKTRAYLNLARSKQEEPCLYYLSGWSTHKRQPLYLTEQSRKATGGLFLRWNGKGIAINPGAHFLSHFHAQGLHIRDIDYVIVTGDQPECYADVKEIYELNYQINKLSEELQIIHYYFNQKAFQELSRLLKPHFKQERNTLHSLELFIDSPDVERLDLGDGIQLNYFQAASREPFPTSHEQKEERAARQHACLGIRLDLKTEERCLRLGYMSHSAWSPLLAHHLGPCDLLITGFGHTGPQDYQKLSHQPDCLGYHGTFSLVEEVAPRLVLAGEFDGREGDIRLEVVQKMRAERVVRPLPPILPADIGLSVNLQTLQVRCSVSEEWAAPGEMKVVKTAQAFGPLAYLSPLYVY